jgi:hypothetical protein
MDSKDDGDRLFLSVAPWLVVGGAAVDLARRSTTMVIIGIILVARFNQFERI